MSRIASFDGCGFSGFEFTVLTLIVAMQYCYDDRMTFYSSKQRLFAFIAMAALLLNALAPSLSHALAKNHTQLSWQQICSQTGVKFVQADLQPKSKQDTTQQPHKNQSGGMPMQDCAYCFPHAGSDSALVYSFAVSSVRLALGVYPALFYAAPDKLFVWAASSPRAPPRISSH